MNTALIDVDIDTQDDEADLRRRLGSGEVAAIADCYRTYGPIVRRYVARFVAHHEIDDVTQAVFFELWRCADRYDAGRSLRAWLLGIARKRALDQLRRSSRRGALVPIQGVGDMVGTDDREQSDRRAAAAEMVEALTKISANQSTVLRLAYFDGYTQTEIAALLHIPLGTVKTRSARGLRQLGQILSDMG